MEKQKELIIPLIKRNRWYKEEEGKQGDKGDSKGHSPSEKQDAVESQAVKELIEGMDTFLFLIY